MRTFLAIFMTLVFMLISHKGVAGTRDTASAKTHTCKVEAGDIGTVIGRGSDPHKAFADAAEQCFDRRASMYERLRGQSVDMERGQMFIDSCVNITCS